MMDIDKRLILERQFYEILVMRMELSCKNLRLLVTGMIIYTFHRLSHDEEATSHFR